MATHYLLVHNTLGVYLGNCLGLGFWSKLDGAGQTEAVTFPSVRDAHDHVNSWNAQEIDGFYPVTAPVQIKESQVNKNGSGYATMEQVVKAGFEDWTP